MYRSFGDSKFVTVTTPTKDSLFHAIAFATDRSYRSGKLAVDDGDDLVLVPVNSDEYVTSMKKQLIDKLSLPVEIGSDLQRYEQSGLVLADAIKELSESQKFTPKMLDYIAKQKGIQIEVYTAHKTPKVDNGVRIIIAEVATGYVLLGQMSEKNELIMIFSSE